MEITENKLKEILTEQRQEFQKSTDKALEQNRQEFQRSIDKALEHNRQEFQRSTDKALEHNRQEFQHSTDKALEKNKLEFQHFMGIMKEDTNKQFQLIGEQIQSINHTLDTHTQMIGALMEDVTIIKSDVQFLKVELKKKVDYDEFNALASRVSALESKARR